MLLQIKNMSDYDQEIMLHTGETKSVQPGLAIRVNTGTDRRLSSFYAQLINYNFQVSVLQASGQENNSFIDAVSRIQELNRQSMHNKEFQDKNVYAPVQAETPAPKPLAVADPLTLDKSPISTPVRVANEVPNESGVNKAPAPVKTRAQQPDRVTVVDNKLGEVIADYSPQLPDDYPEIHDPVLDRLEAEESKLKAEAESSDKKWYAVDELTEEQCKKLLVEEFNENTRLRNKSRIVSHIIELADDAELDVFALVDKYRN